MYTIWRQLILICFSGGETFCGICLFGDPCSCENFNSKSLWPILFNIFWGSFAVSTKGITLGFNFNKISLTIFDLKIRKENQLVDLLKTSKSLHFPLIIQHLEIFGPLNFLGLFENWNLKKLESYYFGKNDHKKVLRYKKYHTKLQQKNLKHFN